MFQKLKICIPVGLIRALYLKLCQVSSVKLLMHKYSIRKDNHLVTDQIKFISNFELF